MRPSSSSSEDGAAGLFGSVLARGPAAGLVDDAAWLAALLRAEAALAGAQAQVGVIPAGAAEVIAAACADLGAYDIDGLGRAAADPGNPVVALVAAIRALVGPEVARYVHHGATSQDILDTAMMLVAAGAGTAVAADLAAAAEATARLAATHRDDPMIGRTLMQQAVPTTFGLKAAGWTLGLDAVARRLVTVLDVLPAQLGGAVGTAAALAGNPADALAVRDAFAAQVGLLSAPLAWHTLRLPVSELASALGSAAGVVAKIALDVVLLAQTEVGEVREGVPGRGGSSTMAHKENPVAAISARAAALRAPGLVATLLACMAQEHERAAGAWHAEWETLCDLLRVTGSAASWLADSVSHLVVDNARMVTNLGDAAPDLGAAALLVDRVLEARP